MVFLYKYFNNQDIKILLFKYIKLASLVFFISYIIIYPPRFDDIWWRLYSGKNIFESFSVPVQNSWSYVFGNYKWINHAWGYDLILFILWKIGGIKLVSYVHEIFIILIFLLSYKRIGAFSSWIVAILLLTHHSIRPYVFGDLFFLIMAIILKENYIKSKYEQFIIGFIIWLLWGNIHGSSVAGLLFLLAYSIYYFKYLYMVLGSIIGILLNPYGINLIIWSLNYMLFKHDFLYQLQEWHKPDIYRIILAIFFVVITSNVARLKGKLIAIGVLFVSVLTIRNIPLVIVLSPVWTNITNNFDIKNKNVIYRPYLKIIYLYLLFLVLGILLYFPQISKKYITEFYPYQGVKFMLNYYTKNKNFKENTTINVFTTHAWAGSVLWGGKGKFKIFIDARNDAYPPTAFNDYFQIIKGQGNWIKLLESADGVFLPVNHPLVKALVSHDWEKVAAEEQWVFLVNSP